ncbi:uncharacterized protein LOC111716702 [Eurytemora carolleeae]|uniref:uncharacterized protein LOC111716702 n=1 Tax=Eurytemora carolleeae TaxID=1294199 RepID=UPI000C78AADC|nr:uncharacterized protein LOC111716702 [Eurytemora carolleeae]|eukprot:XP_023347944.1 uncharacterized protein LOC111716702 [Eurytemora affinis]
MINYHIYRSLTRSRTPYSLCILLYSTLVLLYLYSRGNLKSTSTQPIKVNIKLNALELEEIPLSIPQDEEEQLKRAFRSADLDGGGELNLEELTSEIHKQTRDHIVVYIAV